MTGGANHSGKPALVTGGNRGIGLETARQLAELGFTVLIGVRDLARGEAAARALGGKVEAVELDVAAPEAAARAAAEVERRFGRLDVLVNNAAIHYDPSARALRPDWTVIREAFETNVFGALADRGRLRAAAWRVRPWPPRQRLVGRRLARLDGRGRAGLFDEQGDAQRADPHPGGRAAWLGRAGQFDLSPFIATTQAVQRSNR